MAKDTKVIFSGFGGQGVLTLGQFVAFTALEHGKKVTWMPSYGAEMRGGTANCSVVVSEKEIGSPIVGTPDIVIAMNKPSVTKFESMVVKGGTLVIDSSIVDPSMVTRTDINVISVPATDIASKLGAVKVANMVMCGALMGVAPELLTMEAVEAVMADKFGGKKAQFIPLNREAIKKGQEIAQQK